VRERSGQHRAAADGSAWGPGSKRSARTLRALEDDAHAEDLGLVLGVDGQEEFAVEHLPCRARHTHKQSRGYNCAKELERAAAARARLAWLGGGSRRAHVGDAARVDALGLEGVVELLDLLTRRHRGSAFGLFDGIWLCTGFSSRANAERQARDVTESARHAFRRSFA
jgi:hypothetical protein